MPACGIIFYKNTVAIMGILYHFVHVLSNGVYGCFWELQI